MKSLIRFGIALICLPSFLFTSCKKQIEVPQSRETQLALTTTASSTCTPAVFATYRPSTGIWSTIVQKWYAGQKIQNIKTNFSGGLTGALFHTEPVFNIDWGEVTYEGDQVRVKDVAKNLLVFRATLNNLGKPVASYLYNYTGSANENVFIDTSYYYYAGDRLTSIIQLFEYRLNNVPTNHGWEWYTFTYSASGNVAYYNAKNEETTGEFRYWSTTVKSYADYTLTTAFKMLEYLDLTNLFSNSSVIQFKLTRQHGTYLPFTYYDRGFYNFSASDGLLRYYLTPLGGSGWQDYYIGWECGGPASVSKAASKNNAIMNLSQFQELYPAAK